MIGTGIAGMGCGYLLHRRYELTFYEKNSYIGGHTNTLTVDEDGREVKIDAGFIVYNEVTYPNLTRLFKELGVETKPTSMSFSVQHLPSRLEFSGSGYGGLFAQPGNLFNLKYLKMLWQINRFNTECVEVLSDSRYARYTLADYVQEKGYGDDFLHRYIVPMSSAVWSTEPDLMLKFPAMTLVRFFHNHGFLGLHTQLQWRTVVGGSWNYRDRLIAPFRDRIHVGRGAVKVARAGSGVEVHASDGTRENYDAVILACHADEALALLGSEATVEERSLLEHFRYQANTALLHTDERVMPKARRAWASWNYRLEYDRMGGLTPSTVYYMNSLQQVSDRRNYFISINDPGNVDNAKVLRRIEYTHPIYSLDAMEAQKRLSTLNENGRVYFCGSYFNYGFHEDAFTSAIRLCERLTGEKTW